MKKINVITFFAIVALGTTMLQAQASRTWVSGVGDDANPCSRTAPCKTFAGAISKTAPGGEIDALDPGGFGALTITKSIKIDGGGGQVASVLVAGTNGIVVAAGANDIVILRNIRFEGLRGGGNANAGLSGIRWITGAHLVVENCYISGFNNNGIDIALGAAGEAHVLNTVIENVGGSGIKAQTTAGIIQLGVDNSSVYISTIGIEAAQHSRVLVKNSITESASDSGMKADDGASTDAQMFISRSESGFNTNGITAAAGGSVAVDNSKIQVNSSCAFNQGGGTINSYQSGTGNGTNAVGGPNCGGNPGTINQQ